MTKKQLKLKNEKAQEITRIQIKNTQADIENLKRQLMQARQEENVLMCKLQELKEN